MRIPSSPCKQNQTVFLSTLVVAARGVEFMFFRFKMLRAWETAQEGKHEDLSLVSWTHKKEIWMWWHTLVISVLGRGRQVDGCDSLASQPSLLELQASEVLLSSEKGG